MEAEVIELPPRLVCSACENFMCGPLGLYCSYWREELIDEKVAEDCNAFSHY